MLAMKKYLTSTFVPVGLVWSFALVLMGSGCSPLVPSLQSHFPWARLWLSVGFLQGNAAEERDVVLAKLGKQEIWWSQVAYRWRLAGAKGVELNQVEPWVLVEGVEGARKQRVAQAELDRRGLGVSREEVDRWIERRLDGIEGVRLTAEELAKREGLSLAHWQSELRWQRSWEKYTEPLLTDVHLQRHYALHRDWFDGTEREVFHILRPLQWQDRNGRDKVVKEFAEILQQIRAKELSFEAAARKWSSGATAEQGGRLGWIAYDGAMHPSFNREAFALVEGEVSDPVETPHGVHLIWVRSVKRGELPLGRVIENVRRSLLLEEFEKLVSAYPRPPKIEWVHTFP